MDEERVLLTIGQLSRRTGLPVRTIRYWSDVGVVRPAGRSDSGYRLYDAESVARLELVATLRELGLGLAEVRRVLERETTVAEVAAAQVLALDTQIRALRLRRGVLATVAERGSSAEEMTLMNKLARLSAQERKQLIDDFVDEVFRGLDVPESGLRAHLRQAPELPDDPTAEQVDAWVELAELVQDPGFRLRVRAMAEYAAREQARGAPEYATPEQTVGFVGRVAEHAGAALERGVAPESAEGAEVLRRIFGNAPGERPSPETLRHLETFTDARAERYWQLVGVINGWPPFPARVPAFEWVIAALRAHS